MSSWGDVAAAVSKFAPILGNAVPGIGTLIGGGVGLAASVIAKALGTTPDPDAVMTALSSDPDAIVKLRQAEMDHETALAQIVAQREQNQLAAQTAQYQADAEDRASARTMATVDKDHTARNLAYVYTGALIVVLSAHLYMAFKGVEIGTGAATILGNIEGVLIAMVLGTKEFYFGSSQAAVRQSAAITAFATTPGAVTSQDGGTTTVQAPTDSPQTVTVTSR